MASFTTPIEDQPGFNVTIKPISSTSNSGETPSSTDPTFLSVVDDGITSSGESPGNDSITVSKETLLQFIDALSTSARLLKANIDSAGVGTAREVRSQETKIKSPITPIARYQEVEIVDLERIAMNHAIITDFSLSGKSEDMFREYTYVYTGFPFQNLSSDAATQREANRHIRSVVRSDRMENCPQIQKELWELLLGFRYDYIDWQSNGREFRSSAEQLLISPKQHEFLLLVHVMSEKLGLQALSNESEAEYEQTLRILVSICGAGCLYIDCGCDMAARAHQSSCKLNNVSHLERCLMWSNMRIGTILSGLYAERILLRPAGTDLGSLRLDAARVMQALYPLRCFISEFDWKERFHSRTICPDALHSNEILNMTMTDLIRLVSKEEKSDWLRSTGLSFPIRLLNVSQLQNIGNINIEWTSNLYEHLELSFSGYATLKIYWFAWSTLELPIARMGSFAQNSREELLSTYHLLFGVSSRDSFMSQSRNALRKYNELLTHPSLSLQHPYIHPHKRVGKLATKVGRPYNYGADYHLSIHKTHISSITATDNPQDLYENFPVFEDKLRILVAYMYTQKPEGLRGLWHDNWVFLWIGGISLIIGVFSLGATVTQTVVAFKALQPGSAG